jgi:hypothetical protein
VDPNRGGPLRFAVMLLANRDLGRGQFPFGGPALQALVTAGWALALVPLLACGTNPGSTEAVGSTSSAVAITGLFPTGVDAMGALLADGTTDPHYVLTTLDPLRLGPAAPVIPANGGWTPDTTTSKWIGAATDGNGASGAVYTYTTTFSLAGADPTTATLSGSWACDDSCTLVLNTTHLVATYTVPGYESVATFTVAAGSGFVAGTNTLSFVTTNSGGGPTGLQVVSLGASASCTTDAVCGTGAFCNTQTGACANKLANGAPLPTISGHTPPLNGTCSATVGTAICAAAVCGSNNECGLANGDGTCVAAVTGSVVCQSGSCSTNLKCEPSGGCNLDADCMNGRWCQESTNTCMAKLPNGSPIPADATHTNPTLSGTCTGAAAGLVCASGVCDTTDNKCGIATGDPGCAVATAVVCRSGMCSLLGTCEPMGGCNEDADCPPKQWCDESTHTCSLPLPNLSPIPDDPPHTDPTLNGTCNAGAGTLVCQSGLCNSTSNTCVECTTANTSACSGLNILCGPTGLCVPAVDAGVDAGGLQDAGADAGLDAGLDGGAKADSGADGGPTATGDSGTDGSADATAEASAGDDASGGDDGSAGDDASGGDDATTGAGRDASSGNHNGGTSVSGELEGGGLSCSVSWSRSSESSGGPLLMLAIALGAAFGRGRRKR